MVRLEPNGPDRARRGGPDALGQSHNRPPRFAHARLGGGGDHAGLSDRVHAHGHGDDFCAFCLLVTGSWQGCWVYPRFDGSAHLCGDE